jgi:hypothetical protein
VTAAWALFISSTGGLAQDKTSAPERTEAAKNKIPLLIYFMLSIYIKPGQKNTPKRSPARKQKKISQNA